MKNKGLTITMVIDAESANYGEGFNNITTLKKLTRGENDEVLKTEEILKGTTVEQWDPYSTEGFIGWFTDNNEVFDFNTEIQNDLTLHAKWSTVEDITTHLVTFLVDDEFYQSLLVPENETAPEPEAPLKEGYTFVGWYENDTLFDFNTPITSSHTLVARFQ